MIVRLYKQQLSCLSHLFASLSSPSSSFPLSSLLYTLYWITIHHNNLDNCFVESVKYILLGHFMCGVRAVHDMAWFAFVGAFNVKLPIFGISGNNVICWEWRQYESFILTRSTRPFSTTKTTNCILN